MVPEMSRTPIQKIHGHMSGDEWSKRPIQISTFIHRFIDRLICHNLITINLRENTVDIDGQWKITVDRRQNIEIICGRSDRRRSVCFQIK